MFVLTPSQYRPGTIAAIPAQVRKRGNQRTRKTKTVYKDIIAAFDIETTRLTGREHQRFLSVKGENERSIMYVWMFHVKQFGKGRIGTTIVGRTWEQFRTLLQGISAELGEETLVIWVHNLSYEFQFLRGIYNFANDEVFALQSRKILKCTMYGNIEFRCSYLHSNMSLDEYTHKMGAEHGKLSGAEFDYSKIRYPWTPLDPVKELPYCIHDVLGLCEALEIEMDLDGDNLYTVPLTSTGYVRRDVKKAMRNPHCKRLIESIFPSEFVFTLLREAFGGGNTHANRYFAGRVLHNVKSMDRSSSYPDTQCNDLYPVSAFTEFGCIPYLELNALIKKRKRAVVVRLAMTGVRLADHTDGAPYLCYSHCRQVINPALDNGRILSADYLETTVTDVDLGIIMRHYDMDDIVVKEGAHARYGRLPREMVECICQYYKDKTELKDVPGQELYYMKSKNKLNSIYGMTATNPAKQEILYNDGAYDLDDKPLSELLAEAQQRAFITYAWGVWCTALARWKLQCGIDAVQETPGAFFVYCDTDSVKYLGDVSIDDFNKASISASKKSGACAKDPSGHWHYMGVYEQERTYLDFATLGAKKYAFTYTPGPGATKVTIAGVTKKSGGRELDYGDKWGTGIDRFCDVEHPFTFHVAGGTEIIYQDDTQPPIEIDGHRLELPPCAVIRDSTYTLGVTAEYDSLIRKSVTGLAIWQHQ